MSPLDMVFDPSLKETDDYLSLLCLDTPLLDVRAPIEFAQGAFLKSHNQPLLNDSEREQIGIRYKNAGQDKAIALGAELISGEVKDTRVKHWLAFMQKHPDAVLYCFRGGMRSKICQQWILDASGVNVPRIKGGYKALRRYLIDQTVALSAKSQPLILSGRTGSGKTHVLKKLRDMVDLEGLANHRGSSIGRQLSPQPTQIQFENLVALEMIKFFARGVNQFVVEDESPNVGSVHVPHALYDKMHSAPCVVLEVPLEQRVAITLQEYVVEMYDRFLDRDKSEALAMDALSAYLIDSLTRVKRRLGGAKYQEILKDIQKALSLQAKTGDTSGHQDWLRRMLCEYYDPMYDFQRERRGREVLFTAGHDEMVRYLSQDYGSENEQS